MNGETRDMGPIQPTEVRGQTNEVRLWWGSDPASYYEDLRVAVEELATEIEAQVQAEISVELAT